MTGSLPALDELLGKLVSVGGSDLHLKVGSPPTFRIDGLLHRSDLRKLMPDDTEQLLREIVPEPVWETFKTANEADFAYGKSDLGRFRVNCFRQRGSISVVVRSVAPVTDGFVELGLPNVVEKLVDPQAGIVFVTGPAGSGKTTTAGALIDHINATRRVNIITLEDPIEILHPDKMSIVSQREVGMDTASFAEGLRRALRQDPDVIFVGEMRNQDTVEAALQAAETGHLVVTVLPTFDAVETLGRIIELFPPFQQGQVRQMMAGSLKGVISQQLLPRADGKGRVPAVEVLVNYDRVAERLVNPELSGSLSELIAEGDYFGMQTYDQAIMTLYERGEIALQDALGAASSSTEFKLAAQSRGLTTV